LPFLLSLLQINFSFISRHTNIKVSVLLSRIFSFIFVFIVLRHRRIRQKRGKIMSSNKRRNERKNKEIFDNFLFLLIAASHEELKSENLFFSCASCSSQWHFYFIQNILIDGWEMGKEFLLCLIPQFIHIYLKLPLSYYILFL